MIIAVFHAIDPAQDFRKVERLDGNALRFQNFLAVTHGVESGGASTDSADPEIAESVHDSTDGREPLQIVIELRRVRSFCVKSCDGVGNAVLPQVVAGGHLAAETIAA